MKLALLLQKKSSAVNPEDNEAFELLRHISSKQGHEAIFKHGISATCFMLSYLLRILAK